MAVPDSALNARIGSSIAVREKAPAEAEVLFVSIDDRGTPGRLNSEILRQIGTKVKLPGPEMLRSGYAIVPFERGSLCYIVTVTKQPASKALPENLSKALAAPLFDKVKSVWIPLMGTGTGGLKPAQSFSIILRQLLSDERVAGGGLEVVIALPELLEPEQRELISEEIRRAGREMTPQVEGATAPPPGGSPTEGEADGVPPIDPPPSDPPPDDPYDLPRSPAVTAALAHATALTRQFPEPRKSVLSSTLLFFALADSQSSAAPKALANDISAEFFASAVRYLAGSKYAAAWKDYFGNETRPKPTEEIAPLAPPSANMSRVLKAGAALVGPNNQIEMDHLINALLSQHGTRLQQRLAAMNLAPERVLEEIGHARIGQIAQKFNNDVATSEDQLGYASYAEAIHAFLTHEETLAPLSISIQAPWGGGKSSLMNLVRERLDPEDIRDAHKTPTYLASAKKLLLGSVIKLLDDQDNYSEEQQATAEAPKHLWTIWFNAWKYDTSEQVWAGLVDAIVSQVADRLPLIEREKFLLRLQVARIDDTILRKRIYDRVLTMWWAKVRALTLTGVTVTLGFIGVGAAKPDPTGLPAPVAEAIKGFADFALTGAVIAQVVLSVYLVVNYFLSRNKVRNEPATFSLADYIRVPDYQKAVGEIHHIHADLMRVLKVVPREPGTQEHAPLVIFIDDLDRCSPGKVASVVEGVSMLLASNSYRCMFVIGMDPQMVAAALEAAHDAVRKQLPRYERAVPLGWRFMDKFIQLPFTIPPTGGQDFARYVDWLIGSESPPNTSRVAEITSNSSSGVATQSPAPNVLEAAAAVRQQAGGETEGGTGPARGEQAPHRELHASLESRTPSAAAEGERVQAFVESRDVGVIIRNISGHSVGNPREMKRMVNMARFYLTLRAARRKRRDGWIAPTLDQYARWIAVTLRWPDMMRWLQWGADEAQWPPSELGTELIVRRLRKLETHPDGQTPEKWRETLKKDLSVPIEAEDDWACDPKLYEFFQAESKLGNGSKLSDAALSGFW